METKRTAEVRRAASHLVSVKFVVGERGFAPPAPGSGRQCAASSSAPRTNPRQGASGAVDRRLIFSESACHCSENRPFSVFDGAAMSAGFPTAPRLPFGRSLRNWRAGDACRRNVEADDPGVGIDAARGGRRRCPGGGNADRQQGRDGRPAGRRCRRPRSAT